MSQSSSIAQLIVYLGAMIVVVPISKRLGLGSVLGYLIAGVLLGPHALGLIADSQQDALHLAEFGIIMMLLLIGMELNPSVLWRMRGPIFGLGGAQVAVTAVLFGLIATAAGLAWQSAAAIGMILTVSSTAIVIQTMAEKGYAKSVPGQHAFAVLLLQDIAVIPMLALLPLLATSLLGEAGGSTAATRPGWQQAILILSAIGALVVGGRFIVRPAFRLIAQLKLRETFTAMALLLVAATTALMQGVGLSPALGAFLAGVVLADSEYRHQIEADLEPFKGLLLGLFFISIGAGVDMNIPVTKPLAVAGTVVALVVLKAALVYAIGRVLRMQRSDNILLSVTLAQGGEFAFVLLSLAADDKLLAHETVQILTAAVAVSMALAPLLISATLRWFIPLLERRRNVVQTADVVDADQGQVVVIGVGRFGQVIVRLLRANGFKTTVLDYSPAQIEVMKRFGIKTYFGDGTRPEVLRAAGIGQAKILVIAIDDQEGAVRIAEEARQEYPHLKIYARAYDRVHAYKLIHLGIEQVMIETGGSAVSLGIEILRGLGFSALRAHRQGLVFDRYNRDSIRELAPLFHQHDATAFQKAAAQRINALESLLSNEGKAGAGETAWEAPPGGGA